MKKLIISITVMLIAMLSFSGIAYAQDNETHITLVDKDKFAVDLQGNKLVFIGEPLSKEYETIYLEIEDKNYSVIRKLEYERGNGDGATIDLTGIADGTYTLRATYLPVGFADIIDAWIIDDNVDSDIILEKGDLYNLETYDSNGDNFMTVKEVSAWATVVKESLKIDDYDGDGVADTFCPYFYASYEEAYAEAYDYVFEEFVSGGFTLNDGTYMKYITPAFNIVINGGKANFKKSDSYINNLKIAAKERADGYAADFYKNKDDIKKSSYSDIRKQAISIVSGIKDDYEKAKAIYLWLYHNIEYDYITFFSSLGVGDGGDSPPQDAAYVLKNRLAVCDGFSNLTVALLQAANIPAKKITGDASGFGGWGPHAWTEAYIDNHWIFIDSTFAATSGNDYFDISVAQYSKDHIRDDLGAYDPDNEINDSLYFYDSKNNIMLKEVKKFPFNGVVNSTYGFNIKDLYFDRDSKKPFKLGTMKVDSSNGVIYVDYCRGKESYSVIFSIVDNNGYGLDYDDETYCNYGNNKPAASMWYYFTPANAKLKKPIDPVRKGYTFTGWYNSDTGKKWNFETDKVTSKLDGMRLVSRWEKTASTVTKYKVTFNANNGVSPKTINVEKGSKLSKPDTPSPRTGYKFTGWYKDSKCTQVWDFSKDKVTANTVLYAGWKKI